MNDTPKRDKIAVRNLYKVFGDHPQEGMRLIREGRDKDEIFAETGQTVGVVDANFTIREGEIFVIMGLSGSGKSTMVRMFNRLYEPTSGSIEIEGEDIVKLDNEGLRKLRRDTVSMVFQSFALMPHMKVIDNVAFGLELGGISAARAPPARHDGAGAQVGLAANADSYPDELSGGMQQTRRSRPRALRRSADPPDDEAFSALDPLIRSEMQDELLMLQEEKQRTIIFISHDLDEAMRIGDRIAIMQGGVVVQVGTPEEILKNPANDYVRSFFRGVDVSKVLTARDIARRTQVTLIDKPEQGPRAAIRTLETHDREYGYVLGRNRRFLGVASLATLDEARKADHPLEKALLPDCPTISPETHLGELMNVVATTPYAVPVIDENGRYAGAVSRSALLQALDNMIGEDKPAMAAAADTATPQTEAREGV